MGLDNGIMMKGKTKEGKKFLKKYFSEWLDKYYTTEKEEIYEVTYWRKYWNLRNLMFDNNFGVNEDHYILKIADLPVIVEKVIKPFLNEDYWNENDNSIWDWDEAIRNLGNNIFNLRYLMRMVEQKKITDNDIEIWFYDSY